MSFRIKLPSLVVSWAVVVWFAVTHHCTDIWVLRDGKTCSISACSTNLKQNRQKVKALPFKFVPWDMYRELEMWLAVVIWTTHLPQWVRWVEPTWASRRTMIFRLAWTATSWAVRRSPGTWWCRMWRCGTGSVPPSGWNSWSSRWHPRWRWRTSPARWTGRSLCSEASPT